MMGRPGMNRTSWGTKAGYIAKYIAKNKDWADSAAEYARQRARRRLFWDVVGAGLLVAVVGSSISWGPALVRWML